MSLKGRIPTFKNNIIVLSMVTLGMRIPAYPDIFVDAARKCLACFVMPIRKIQAKVAHLAVVWNLKFFDDGDHSPSILTL
jgi:hypothetical protein